MRTRLRILLLLIGLGLSGCSTSILLPTIHVASRSGQEKVASAVTEVLPPLGFSKLGEPDSFQNEPEPARMTFGFVSRQILDWSRPAGPLDRFRGRVEMYVTVIRRGPADHEIAISVREGTWDLAIADYVAERIAAGLAAHGLKCRIEKVQTSTIPNVI